MELEPEDRGGHEQAPRRVIIADDRLQPYIDTDAIELIGQPETVRVSARRAKKF